MNSSQVNACKNSLLESPPGTIVSSINGYGIEATHGDSMDWLIAWSECCGFSPDEDVIEIVDDCIHYGNVTRFYVPSDFREKAHRLCLSLGINSKACLPIGFNKMRDGIANLVLFLPKNFTWVVCDFEEVRKSNLAYEASKSSKRFDYAMNMRAMNNAYPAIRDSVVNSGGKYCSPWGRCLNGMRMCSRCGPADHLVMRLHPTVRQACVDRLVADGVVQTEWSIMMPLDITMYIDEYA